MKGGMKEVFGIATGIRSKCAVREAKVETPIHDNTKELVTWECKEHGVKS